jgi:adenylate kinase
MIIFFGPAGAGKSVQGQMLAARMGWRWLSTGQLLRDTHDPEVLAALQTGQLVSDELMTKVLGDALKRSGDIDQVILDGFPRRLEQAEWLVASQPEHNRAVSIVIVLEVPREELLKRLAIRGRADDTPETIDDRLNIYRQEMYPILGYLTGQNVPVAHVDGVGSVGQVHDRIYQELNGRGLA